MHGHIQHFAINADDVAATRAFYEALFGWRFTETFPGFWRTTDAGAAIGAVQGRRTFASDAGFEVTFAVDDADALATAAEAHGGRVLMPKSVSRAWGSSSSWPTRAETSWAGCVTSDAAAARPPSARG